jgi:hypothetical protein
MGARKSLPELTTLSDMPTPGEKAVDPSRREISLSFSIRRKPNK